MEMDVRSTKWNLLPPPEGNGWDSQQKKSLRNKLSTIERAVRMVSMHADACPVVPKDAIRKIATAAEKRVLEALGSEEKTISICKLEKQLSHLANEE